MPYTVISAVYANPSHTAIVAKTEEVGEVAISHADMLDEWDALINSGIEIPPYTAPVPSVVSAYQAKAALMNAGLFAVAENAAAAAGGLTLLAWQTAGEFQRQSPAIAALAAAVNLSDAQVDELFIAASKLTA